MRCCRCPTRRASSTSPAGWSSSTWSSSPPAAPPARWPTRASPVRPIEDFTGFPEMMDGRVKTLHPRLYAGLLARRDDDAHLRAAAEHAIEPVDLVCVNLYPFEQTVARGDAAEQEVDREHRHRRSHDDPRGRQEQRVRGGRGRSRRLRRRCWRELRESDGLLSLDTRTQLATKAFALHRPLRRRDLDVVRARAPTRAFPPTWRDAYEKVADLRYGENPHQQAAFYARVGAPTHLLDGVTQLHGKELSFNNLLDLSSARELVEEFDDAGLRDRQAQQPVRLRRSARAIRVGLRTRLRLRSAQRLRRRDRAQPTRRPRLRRAPLRAVHRGAARARRSTPMRWRCCRPRRTCACWSWRDWPAPSHEVEAKPVIGGQLVQSRDVVAETREQMRAMTATQPSEQPVGGPAVRLAGLPPRALERDRHRLATAPRSASAPGR